MATGGAASREEGAAEVAEVAGSGGVAEEATARDATLGVASASLGGGESAVASPPSGLAAGSAVGSGRA